MEARLFRILSLDGGGIKGAFAASALATFESRAERRIAEHFDLPAVIAMSWHLSNCAHLGVGDRLTHTDLSTSST
jgi:hypothetical protein